MICTDMYLICSLLQPAYLEFAEADLFLRSIPHVESTDFHEQIHSHELAVCSLNFNLSSFNNPQFSHFSWLNHVESESLDAAYATSEVS